VGSHQAGVPLCAPALLTSWLVTQDAGLPDQPEYQNMSTRWTPAAEALAISWSSSVKSKVPCFGSTVFHDMSIAAWVRPSALSAAKLDSDQAVPLLSHLSCVDHSVLEAAACAVVGVAAFAPEKGAVIPAPTMTRIASIAAGIGIRYVRARCLPAAE
jgi:hypothetical protein